MRTIIKNANLVTMNAKREVLFGTDLAVEGERISEIGRITPQEGDQVIPADGQVLMPGLVDAHCHVAMSLFRNYGNDVDLYTWLNAYIWPKEEKLTQEEVACGVRLNLLEMLRGGITSFIDMYDMEEICAREAVGLGIRGVVAPGTTDKSVAEREQSLPLLKKNWQGAAGLIDVMIGPHAVYSCGPDTLARLARLGEKLDLGFHIHLSETKKEEEDCRKAYGKTPTQVLDSYGMLDERTVLAHGVWLSDQDMDLIARRGSSVVHNPASNMKLGSGVMPLKKLQAHGINVALGTDGASSNNAQDLFRDMTLASLIQKGWELDAKAASAKTILEMATINGAKAMGREKDLGSIEVGKLADLLLVDFNNVRHTPFPKEIEAGLVYSTLSEDVSMTMVAGKVLVYQGKFLHADEKKIRQEAQAAWEELKKATPGVEA